MTTRDARLVFVIACCQLVRPISVAAARAIVAAWRHAEELRARNARLERKR